MYIRGNHYANNLGIAHHYRAGFTIVELLIVVVVIGILAAIVIVAYNGITTRAKAAQAISNAETVYKKAEAYYNDPTGGNGSYPLSVTAFKGLPANTLGALPSSIPIVTTDPVNSTDVWYIACLKDSTAIGFIVRYWDFTVNAARHYVGGSGAYGTPTGSANGKFQGVGCSADATGTSSD